MNNQTPNPFSGQSSDSGRESGPEGLLSAYLDGELTAEETEAVEAHLESSEESRQVLDELRLLSDYLADLSPESAPEALRSSLIVSRTRPQPTSRSLRVPLIAAVIAVAALVMVVVLPQLSPWSPASSETITTNLATLESTPDEPETASADAVAEISDSSNGVTIAGGGKLVFNKTPNKAEVGQILSAIDTSDGKAVVVRLTVVDVKQGLDSLRLLLQKHQIASVDAVAFGGDRDRGLRNQVAGKQAEGLNSADGQLVSVVVQASSDQVSEAMASLRREMVSEMELTGVLQMAALKTAPGGRLALERLESFGNQKSRSRAARTAPGGRRPAPAGDGAKPEASRATSRKNPVLASAQVRLDLPAELMQKVDRAHSDAKPKANTRDRGERQLQVVFVLVGTPRPAAPPQPEPEGAA